MKNKMKNVFVLLLSLLLAMLCLTACGKKSGLSKSKLQEDLQNNKLFYGYGMWIDDFEIVKRQTLPEKQSDTVWVKVSASDSEASGEMYYQMEYTLYNDGWKIESIKESELDEWSFKPKKSLSDEELLEMLQKRYPNDTIELLSNEAADFSDFDNIASAVLRASYSRRIKYYNCKVIQTNELYVLFGTGYSGQSYEKGGRWYIEEGAELSCEGENWDIPGRWTDGKYTLEVKDGTEAGTYDVNLKIESDDYSYYEDCHQIVKFSCEGVSSGKPEGKADLKVYRHYTRSTGYTSDFPQAGDVEEESFTLIVYGEPAGYRDSHVELKWGSTSWDHVYLERDLT